MTRGTFNLLRCPLRTIFDAFSMQKIVQMIKECKQSYANHFHLNASIYLTPTTSNFEKMPKAQIIGLDFTAFDLFVIL